MSFREWSDKIKSNFEDKFYIGKDPSLDNKFTEAKYINKRGIYKDTYLSSAKFTDY